MKPVALYRAAAAVAVILVVAALSLPKLLPARAGTVDRPVPAPEFTHQRDSDWINSVPLRIADLRGKVLLIDFWTFDCWNCYRSFPWLKSLEARLDPARFLVIGVHTPEFDREKQRNNIVAKVAQFGLRHPVMIDNDYSYWQAMGNRYWPAWYLVDKSGRIRAVFQGETHSGERQAEVIENNIRELLNEPAG